MTGVRAAALLLTLAIVSVACGPRGHVPGVKLGPEPPVTARHTGEPLREPSGAVWHPGRRTWFAVGDGGDIAEFADDGTVRRWHHVRKADFEGVTVDPRTGLLYVAEEGPALIHEIDPDSWAIRRSFAVEHSFRGKPVIDPEKDNLEGITFVPDASHPEGGTFWVTNQSRRVRAGSHCPSALIQVTAPIASGRDGDPAVIRRVVHPGLVDLAGVCYDAGRRRLWVVSDKVNRLIACDLEGVIVGLRRLPGQDQEGVAVRGDRLWIPQDSGGILELSLANGR